MNQLHDLLPQFTTQVKICWKWANAFENALNNTHYIACMHSADSTTILGCSTYVCKSRSQFVQLNIVIIAHTTRKTGKSVVNPQVCLDLPKFPFLAFGNLSLRLGFYLSWDLVPNSGAIKLQIVHVKRKYFLIKTWAIVVCCLMSS